MVASSILEHAAEKIADFNSIGLHYNIVSDAVHGERSRCGNPFGPGYLPYLIAGLISFDMGRFMGKNPYSLNGGFASRLFEKLQKIRQLMGPLVNLNLLQVDLRQCGDDIKTFYEILASCDNDSLHSNKEKRFDVGTTKILHFLNPELFIIIDSNAARVFRSYWGIPFRNSTQPGYTAKLYLECMNKARAEIAGYGLKEFQALEPGTPITRIFDKITFILGSEIKNGSKRKRDQQKQNR